MEIAFDDVHGDEVKRDALLTRVSAFVAPVASNAGAVVDDPSELDLADAIYTAFGDLDGEGGLTRAQLAHACADICPDESRFDSRFDLFCRLGMLMPIRDKSHQQRYVFNPTSAAALMVFERLGHDGGVQEIMTLLDRTRAGLQSGVASYQQVRNALMRARRGFAINADHLNRLVRVCPLEELLAERRHHRASDTLLTDAKNIITMIVHRLPALATEGDRLIREAVRYSKAVQDFIGRVLEEATAHRDFSMLDAEQYRTAALVRNRDELADVFASVLFDPPAPPVDANTIATAIDQVRPRPPRRRPPPPSHQSPREDPVSLARERAERVRQRRILAAERGLDGEASVDLTSTIRSAGWPGASRLVTEMLAAHADPTVPYQVELGEALIVDPPGPVTHVSPVTLYRDVAREYKSRHGWADVGDERDG